MISSSSTQAESTRRGFFAGVDFLTPMEVHPSDFPWVAEIRCHAGATLFYVALPTGYSEGHMLRGTSHLVEVINVHQQLVDALEVARAAMGSSARGKKRFAAVLQQINAPLTACGKPEPIEPPACVREIVNAGDRILQLLGRPQGITEEKS